MAIVSQMQISIPIEPQTNCVVGVGQVEMTFNHARNDVVSGQITTDNAQFAGVLVVRNILFCIVSQQSVTAKYYGIYGISTVS